MDTKERGRAGRLNEESDPDTNAVIVCALHVHNSLGPGLLESAYLECLCIELATRGVAFEREVPLDVTYRGRRVAVRYRLDLLVAASIVIEVKALEHVLPVHRAQLLSYLRLGGYTRGLLINFGVPRLRDGLFRVVNGWSGAS